MYEEIQEYQVTLKSIVQKLNISSDNTENYIRARNTIQVDQNVQNTFTVQYNYDYIT